MFFHQRSCWFLHMVKSPLCSLPCGLLNHIPGLRKHSRPVEYPFLCRHWDNLKGFYTSSWPRGQLLLRITNSCSYWWWQAVWFLVCRFRLSRPTLVFSHQFLGYLSEKNDPKTNKTSEPELSPPGKSPAPECWWLLMVESRGSNAIPSQAPGG